MILPQRKVAIDTETTGLNPYRKTTHVILTQLWDCEGNSEVCKIPQEVPHQVIKDLGDPEVLTLWWNARFDIPLLQKMGLMVRGPFIDVMLMARMCCPEEMAFSLKHFSRKFLDDSYHEEILLKKYIKKHKINVNQRGFQDVPDHLLLPYGHKDAKNTYELFVFLSAAMNEFKLWPHLHHEMALMRRVVMPMESIGILADPKFASELLIEGQAELRILKARICKAVGNPKFNANSNPQVVKAIYNEDHPPTRYSKQTGNPSADTLALLQLGTPLALDLIKFRKVSKAVSTYLLNINKALDDNNVFRVSFNQLGARTGRWSSSGYEVKGQLQNQPSTRSKGVLGQIRNIFIARPGGRLVFGDLDQVEMRLMAHALNDKEMIEAIHQGKDLHSLACVRLLDKDPEDKKFRYIAKQLNFVGSYGASPSKFIEVVQKSTDGEITLDYQLAADAINNYREMMTPLRDMCDAMIAETGGITTFYDNFIPVSSSKVHAGPNYYIQGTAARLLKLMALDMEVLLRGSDILMILQVHDELGFDVPTSNRHLLPQMKSVMTDLDTFKVPITSSWAVAKRWGSKKDIKLTKV